MNKYLSVVLPVYNEEKNIESLMNELNNYFNVNLNFEYEIILIDNCSTDQSFNILSKFISENIKVIKNKKIFCIVDLSLEVYVFLMQNILQLWIQICNLNQKIF